MYNFYDIVSQNPNFEEHYDGYSYKNLRLVFKNGILKDIYINDKSIYKKNKKTIVKNLDILANKLPNYMCFDLYDYQSLLKENLNYEIKMSDSNYFDLDRLAFYSNSSNSILEYLLIYKPEIFNEVNAILKEANIDIINIKKKNDMLKQKIKDFIQSDQQKIILKDFNSNTFEIRKEEIPNFPNFQILYYMPILDENDYSERQKIAIIDPECNVIDTGNLLLYLEFIDLPVINIEKFLEQNIIKQIEEYFTNKKDEIIEYELYKEINNEKQIAKMLNISFDEYIKTKYNITAKLYENISINKKISSWIVKVQKIFETENKNLNGINIDIDEYNKLKYYTNPSSFKKEKINKLKEQYKPYFTNMFMKEYIEKIDNDYLKFKQELQNILTNTTYKTINISFKYPNGIIETKKINLHSIFWTAENDELDKIPLKSIVAIKWKNKNLIDMNKYNFKYSQQEQIEDFVKTNNYQNLGDDVYMDKNKVDFLVSLNPDFFSNIKAPLIYDEKYILNFFKKNYSFVNIPEESLKNDKILDTLIKESIENLNVHFVDFKILFKKINKDELNSIKFASKILNFKHKALFYRYINALDINFIKSKDFINLLEKEKISLKFDEKIINNIDDETIITQIFDTKDLIENYNLINKKYNSKIFLNYLIDKSIYEKIVCDTTHITNKLEDLDVKFDDIKKIIKISNNINDENLLDFINYNYLDDDDKLKELCTANINFFNIFKKIDKDCAIDYLMNEIYSYNEISVVPKEKNTFSKPAIKLKNEFYNIYMTKKCVYIIDQMNRLCTIKNSELQNMFIDYLKETNIDFKGISKFDDIITILNKKELEVAI